MPALISPDEIRTWFAAAMSTMYQAEVPQYATLLDVVAEVNAGVLRAQPELGLGLDRSGDSARLGIERHGAIRLGTAGELAMMRRLFAVMGMVPVGYYDLSGAGIPVHSTAFRPTDERSLRRNPFRMFTSLLRLDLIDDERVRAVARTILAQRDIFSERLRSLIDRSESAGLNAAEAREFVVEACATFAWRSEAAVPLQTYRELRAIHPIVADIVCFRGPHINHLTPRTLDIDAAQALMRERGLTPKAVIEGPPRRACPILLRQTSFLALDEPIAFRDERSGAMTSGSHTARFGEIEERGVALTPKGRALYDRLLDTARATVEANAEGTGANDERWLREVFAAFPDTEAQLAAEGLAYFRYRRSEAARSDAMPFDPSMSLSELLHVGAVSIDPIVYEDFLPVSAAGIFTSNLGDSRRAHAGGRANRGLFEEQLGASVPDETSLYAEREAASIRSALNATRRSAVTPPSS